MISGYGGEPLHLFMVIPHHRGKSIKGIPFTSAIICHFLSVFLTVINFITAFHNVLVLVTVVRWTPPSSSRSMPQSGTTQRFLSEGPCVLTQRTMSSLFCHGHMNSKYALSFLSLATFFHGHSSKYCMGSANGLGTSFNEIILHTFG